MYKILFFITFSSFTLLAAGCGGPAGTNANGGKPNTNAPVNNNAAGLNPTPKPVAPLENDAPTLAPVVKTYYEALKKKDDALLRTVLSQAFLKEIEQGMKEEKKTGLAAYMAETDRVPEKEIEVRNEKINGDRATAELKGGTYINWSSVDFVREDGKWKMTNGSAETDSMKQTNMPSNSAK
jgi:hypothetical protein